MSLCPGRMVTSVPHVSLSLIPIEWRKKETVRRKEDTKMKIIKKMLIEKFPLKLKILFISYFLS